MTRKKSLLMAAGITVIVAGIIGGSYIPGIITKTLSNGVLFAQNSGTFFSSSGISGSGILKQETRAVRDFSSITMSGVGTLHIRQAQIFKMVIELDDNLLPYYESTVKNGELILGFKTGTSIRNLKELTIYIDMPELKAVSLSGASAIVLDTPFTAKNFKADFSGTGKLSGMLTADAITIDASGAASVILSGKTDTLKIAISGSGSFDCFGLMAKKVYIEASGAASVKVSAQDYLNVIISGASNVQYKGNPKIDKAISGIGSIKAAN